MNLNCENWVFWFHVTTPERAGVPLTLKGGKKVRKDAIKSDGTVVIIKPNTPSGEKSAKLREKLMEKNRFKTEIIKYNPSDPKYRKGSSTYIGPKK